MANRPMEIGPTGRRAAANLAALRGRNITQQDLARRLAEVGHPMTASAISKAEKLDRRLDLDDLVGLSIALDVTPNEILLPPDSGDDPVDLTPAVTVTGERAWHWAAGDLPLRTPESRVDEGSGRRRLVLGELKHQPHRPIDPMTMEQVLEHLAELVAVSRAVKVLEDAGLTRRQVFNGLTLLDTMAAVRNNLDALEEGEQDAS